MKVVCYRVVWPIEEGKEKAVGTCVDFDNFALCIASIHDDVITRVDILKTN